VVHADNKKTSCLKFFCKLVDELIDNSEGIHVTWAAAEQDAGAVATPPLHQRLPSGGPFNSRAARGGITLREGAESKAA